MKTKASRGRRFKVCKHCQHRAYAHPYGKCVVSQCLCEKFEAITKVLNLNPNDCGKRAEGCGCKVCWGEMERYQAEVTRKNLEEAKKPTDRYVDPDEVLYEQHIHDKTDPEVY